jgi:hypothetical protein
MNAESAEEPRKNSVVNPSRAGLEVLSRRDEEYAEKTGRATLFLLFHEIENHF